MDINVTPNCMGNCSGQLEAVVTGGMPFPDGTYLYNWEKFSLIPSHLKSVNKKGGQSPSRDFDCHPSLRERKF